jgi:nucleotide-binding universal stress UspA family protein
MFELDPGVTITHFLPRQFADERQDKRNEGGVSRAVRTAAELRTKKFEPIRYIVPGYIAEGCTLLAGRPKSCKSWLVLEIGLAVASGSTCLGGIACQKGDVLYLALEDNERRLQRRIDKLIGAISDWPARFHYATEWPRANQGGLEKIEHWILNEATEPRLIIVDVLAMFRPTGGGRDNSYEADYQAIKGLQELASRHGVAVVVVHHTRKGTSEIDPIEKVSGTLGLSGAADTIMVLDRDSNGATLYGRGRDIEEIESAVEFDKETCRWVVLGEPTEVRRTDERTALLQLLDEADEPMRPNEIATAIGVNRNNVDQLLYKMTKEGEVRKQGRGRYIHPDRLDLIGSEPVTPDKNDKIRNYDSSSRQCPPDG